MPKLQINDAEIYFEEHGAGPETIVFAHGLLWSGRMFDNQVNALQDRYRCITFDFRGQGQSEVTKSGYDIDTLTEDAAALIEAREPITRLQANSPMTMAAIVSPRSPEVIKISYPG